MRHHRNRHRAILIGCGLAATVPGLTTAAAAAPANALVSSVGDTDLGTVSVGQAASLPFEVSAVGSWAITLIGEPLLSGPDAAQFSITPGTCVDGFQVWDPPATPCTATVIFRPREPGAKSATVTVSGDYVDAGSLDGPPCTSSGTQGAFTCSVSFAVTGTAVAGSPDPTPPDPTQPATPVPMVAAPAPVVAAAITPAVRVIRTGRTARVTLRASNPGPVSVTNVVTSMPIPPGFVVVNRGGGQVAGRAVSFSTASLAVGAVEDYVVVLRPIGARSRRAEVSTTVTASGAGPARASGTITVRAVRKRTAMPVAG